MLSSFILAEEAAIEIGMDRSNVAISPCRPLNPNSPELVGTLPAPKAAAGEEKNSASKITYGIVPTTGSVDILLQFSSLTETTYIWMASNL